MAHGGVLSSEPRLASKAIACPQVLHFWRSVAVFCTQIPTQVFGYISQVQEGFFSFKLGCLEEATMLGLLAQDAPSVYSSLEFL